MPSPQATPPSPDEIEISIFGPGFGESIVAHVGAGRWLVVDSCVDPSSKIPKPLEYLQALGVDPASAVELVAATHWHDDHVRGLSQILEVCRSATFCCADTLGKREFFDFAELYRNAPMGMPEGPSELRTSVTAAVQRSRASKRPMLKLAHADTLIWRTAGGEGVPNASLIALSPSDEMTRRALDFMVREYAAAQEGTRLTRPIAARPNDVAVAMRLDVGQRSALLGTDLEEEGDPLVGWSAVLVAPSAQGSTSSVFKVAHHGSASGHHEDVWVRLLDGEPLAVLTPFRWGRHRLPTASDRARILAKTQRAYITAHPERDLPPKAKRLPKVEGMIRQAIRNRRQAAGPVGHVRWRASLTDGATPGSVELFAGAVPLQAV